MEIQAYVITGFSLAVEYVSPGATGEDEHCVVVDLGVLRFMFFW